jgi:hypothetical protein
VTLGESSPFSVLPALAVWNSLAVELNVWEDGIRIQSWDPP